MQEEVLQRPDTSSFAFASTFQGEDALRTGEWVLSEDERYAGQESRVRVERCNLEGGVFAADFGLLLDESHKHYAVGASFPKPYDNTGKDLVIQYEVQIRDGAQCGGAYVKMLRGEAGEDMTTLNNESPYSVMFGPDKCFRDTNKVHFIFQHQNPFTKEWEEKHFKKTPKIKEDKGFHVYTLHVKTDNTFDLYIDTEVAGSGSLLEDVEPPVAQPKEIDDPDDEQPEDWVTEAMIPDPTAVKPDDWDEDAPRTIKDETAEMPEDWQEDAEEFIPDPSSFRPEDWDDEEDGEWEPIMIANPACEMGRGCGKWTTPLIKNPAYKGPWKAPMIDDPEYRGEWTPRVIANPAYFEDAQPSNMAPITGLAVEIWSVDGGVWLDNFVVGHDIGAALKLAEDTWRPKFEAYEVIAAEEKKQKDLEKDQKKRARDADLPRVSSMEWLAPKFLVDKARPYLPAAAAPALDVAAENPIACIITLLAGMMAVLILAMRKKKVHKPSPIPSAADDGPAPPADVLVGGDAADEDDVDGTRGIKQEEEGEEVEVEDEDDEEEGEQDEQAGGEKEEQEEEDDEDEDEEDEEEEEEQGGGVEPKGEVDAVVKKETIETDASVPASSAT